MGGEKKRARKTGRYGPIVIRQGGFSGVLLLTSVMSAEHEALMGAMFIGPWRIWEARSANAVPRDTRDARNP
jgi:hypothetical protein